MRSRTARTFLIDARRLAATGLAFVLIGCDTNPGGPAAPSRAPAPPEVTATSGPARKPAKMKPKKLAPMERAASYQ